MTAVDPADAGRSQTHVVVVSEDNFTYRWDCHTCGNDDSGFIKRSYADADAYEHASSQVTP